MRLDPGPDAPDQRGRRRGGVDDEKAGQPLGKDEANGTDRAVPGIGSHFHPPTARGGHQPALTTLNGKPAGEAPEGRVSRPRS